MGLLIFYPEQTPQLSQPRQEKDCLHSMYQLRKPLPNWNLIPLNDFLLYDCSGFRSSCKRSSTRPLGPACDIYPPSDAEASNTHLSYNEHNASHKNRYRPPASIILKKPSHAIRKGPHTNTRHSFFPPLLLRTPLFNHPANLRIYPSECTCWNMR